MLYSTGMHSAAVASSTVARLLAGRTVWTIGRLLADTTRAGEVTLLDPATGGELSREDDRPAFILSTEAEATDGHIVRQHWNLSRAAAGGPGAPVLWNHNQDVLLGQWQDLAVQPLEGGPSLVGRAFFDPEDELAQKRKSQVKRGFLNATSVGWIPGERIRRGDLPEGDDHRREREDDACDMPMEGMVMGTEARPNILVEASIVPCPAQAEAVVTERLHRRGAEVLARAAESGELPTGRDLDALLASLASNPRVERWLAYQLTRAVRAELACGTAPLVPPPAAPTRTVADLLRPGA